LEVIRCAFIASTPQVFPQANRFRVPGCRAAAQFAGFIPSLKGVVAGSLASWRGGQNETSVGKFYSLQRITTFRLKSHPARII
jgi:hypothetical protein